MPSSEIYSSLVVGSLRCVSETGHDQVRVDLGDLFGDQSILQPVGGLLLVVELSLIHISEPTRLGMISYAVFRDLLFASRRQPQMCIRDRSRPGPGRSRRPLRRSVHTPTCRRAVACSGTVSYTHLRAHETRHDLVCRLPRSTLR